MALVGQEAGINVKDYPVLCRLAAQRRLQKQPLTRNRALADIMAKKTGKTLVIVESPAKAKTINKYLGDDYVVRASMGHVRDLPKKGIGVDLKTFTPEYEIISERGKEKVVSELKKTGEGKPGHLSGNRLG